VTAEVSRTTSTIQAYRESRGGSEWWVRLRAGLARCGKQGSVDDERSCRSKQANLSKTQAKAISRSMSARHRDAFHVYACQSCRYWDVANLQSTWLHATRVDSWECPAVRIRRRRRVRDRRRRRGARGRRAPGRDADGLGRRSGRWIGTHPWLAGVGQPSTPLR
jgi:hypothetical protein